MKKIFVLLFAVLVASCGPDRTADISPERGASAAGGAGPRITAQSILASAERANYKEGELIVKYRQGTLPASLDRVRRAVGSRKLQGLQFMDAEHVVLPAGLAVRDAVVRYMQEPEVEYAEPNYIRSARATLPNDPYFPAQWALRNTAIPGADLMATQAWDITRGTGGVIIAVIDSGLDYTHPDLAGNVWSNPGEPDCASAGDNDHNGFAGDCRGWNFSGRNNDPMDDNGHGSHVSGAIGAVGNNGAGIAGVMWSVRIMPLKVLDAEGDGTVADELAAIQYAVRNGALVINASFAGDSYSFAEAGAITSANAAGVLFVTAAGNAANSSAGSNNDVTPIYPGNYNLANIISVAASDVHDRLASFSNYGPTTVHVAAPGVAIIGTVPPALSRTFCGSSPSEGYAYCDGTSMATPYVSGLCGLLYSYYLHFNSSQVRATVLRYADQLPSLQGKVAAGRINAYRSLSSLLPPAGVTTAVQDATTVTLAWSDNATGEDGYHIERKAPGGDFLRIASLGADSTSFADSGLSPATAYTYRIQAFNSIPAESPFSAEVVATTSGEPVGPPANTGGGGGGCSVAGRKGSGVPYGDMAMLLLPAAVVLVSRVLRRGQR